MNRRALLIAAVLAALGAVLLVLYLQRFEQEASGGERVHVLMAIKPIKAGETIKDDMLAVRDIPLAYVEDRAVRESERPKVVGLRVGNKVQAQETLFWTDLAIASDEQRDLSSLVQPGNRAMFVRAKNGDKSFALIRPGDYVDVIGNMPADTGQNHQAVVLLQRVLVLAVGLETARQSVPDKSGNGSPETRDMVLTLSVGLQQAQLLSLAVEKGTLTVALRNPDDQRIVQGIPDMSSSALTDEKVRQTVQSVHRGPVRLESNE